MDAAELTKFRDFFWQIMQVKAMDLLGQKEEKGVSLCDYWAIEVLKANQRPDRKEKPLRLGRAIEKLVAFHRHVFSLIRVANSKRMLSSFFSLKITVIPAEKTHPAALSWPLNKREWGDLLERIENNHGLTRGSAVIKAEHKMKSRATKCGVAAIIHCECAMVAYPEKDAALQAFSYIGVSKLSCKACHY